MLKKVCSACKQEKFIFEFSSRGQCKLCRAQKRKEHYQENKDRLIAIQKKYDEQHKSEKIERAKNLYLKDKQTGKHILKTQARRAKIKALDHSLTNTEWKIILSAFDNKCAYCGNYGKEQEHLTPLSRGGEYSIRNIVPACRTCNNKKMKKTLEEFASQETISRIREIQRLYL